MQKPETFLRNEIQKVLWDSEIQTNHLIPARRPDQVVINKNSGVCGFSEVQRENKRKWKKDKQLLGPCQKIKKWGTCKWQWYQLYLVHLERYPKVWKEEWKSWKSEEKSRPSRLQRCCDWLEYSEKSFRSKESCSHSDSNERQTNAGVKNPQEG